MCSNPRFSAGGVLGGYFSFQLFRLDWLYMKEYILKGHNDPLKCLAFFNNGVKNKVSFVSSLLDCKITPLWFLKRQIIDLDTIHDVKANQNNEE